jgi:ubiquinone/menaquinone biosynthesis C-methylase UbiE
MLAALSPTTPFFGLQLWQWGVVAFILLISVFYLVYMFYDQVYAPMLRQHEREKRVAEGFYGGSGDSEASPSEDGGEWLGNLAIYDDFYAGIYDKLVQGEKRSMIEVALLMREWQKATAGAAPAQWRVLDVGCGTGVTATAFAKSGVGHIVALDRSEPMLRRAQAFTLPASTLTDAQKETIEWRQGDAENLDVAAEGEFTHACVMYFSIYYIEDKPAFFRNLYYWLGPEGVLSVHVVNKENFDPMLEAAAPTVFSLQKYASERIMRSQVAFDTFDYEGIFDVDETPGATAAQFREIFRYKDGTVRKQKHTFNMPGMKDIVSLAQTVGWKYRGYTDNVSTGFEYSYTLLFTK